MHIARKQALVFLFAALLVTSLSLQASSPALAAPQEQMDVDTIIRIREEGIDNSQVMDTISWLTDVYGPRL
ncbi:MAG: hypothetical protein PVJ51_11675, partial [Acidobacteriota bacterium]